MFDVVQNLSKPYKPVNKLEKMPLSFLLNTVEYKDNKSVEWDNVSPMIRLSFNDIDRGQHPMPFARVHVLIQHADAALLMIDDAMSASGGLLSVLPMNLPADDPRRQTFLGQMIHFMRVMVSKVAALDKAYGSALGALAGEATVPKQLKLYHFRHEDVKAAFAEDHTSTSSPTLIRTRTIKSGTRCRKGVLSKARPTVPVYTTSTFRPVTVDLWAVRQSSSHRI